MFVGEQCGKAEAAIELYVSAFADPRINSVEDSAGPHAFS
jgi:predicted 3-demethylubiquinone-9 3-methyltransferase (glyoxalase superfamily)